MFSDMIASWSEGKKVVNKMLLRDQMVMVVSKNGHFPIIEKYENMWDTTLQKKAAAVYTFLSCNTS